MTFFLELTRAILAMVPQVLFDPTYALFFWVMMLLIFNQYRRLHAMEVRLYGRARQSLWHGVLSAVFYGLLGGIGGSYLLVLLGVTVGRGDIAYLWPVALVLMLIHPRFICFSYAGGLVSLSYLLFGWPQVNVAGIVGLVGVLHIVEGVLVYLSGSDQATPLYVPHNSGQIVGAFSLQRFWPVPIVILLLLAVPRGLEGAAIDMPGWWPLIKPAGSPAGLAPVMWPVMAALGYGDIAITMSPEQKRQRTALHLVLYSIVLLVLAIGASRWPPLLWLAALATPGLHELMIQVGLRGEMEGQPRFVQPDQGVLLLDVWPDSYGAQWGLRSGDIITAVNGQPVAGRNSFETALQEASFYLELDVVRQGHRFQVDTNRFQYAPGALGIILAPGAADRPHVQLQQSGPLARLWQRLLAAVRAKPYN